MQLRPDDKVLDLATGTADVPWASRDWRRCGPESSPRKGIWGHEKTGGFPKHATGKREGFENPGNLRYN